MNKKVKSTEVLTGKLYNKKKNKNSGMQTFSLERLGIG